MTDLERQWQQCRDNYDYLGIGNLIVEVLMRPRQQQRPDRDAQFVESAIRAVVAAWFDIPETVSYGLPYSDKHLSHELRGSWEHQTFFQLLIFAYMLGATRENLPHPFIKVLPLIRRMAYEQRSCIAQAKCQYSIQRQNSECRHQREYRLREVEQQIEAHRLEIERLRNSNADEDVIEDEIDAYETMLHDLIQQKLLLQSASE